jgi:hypothetical protein
MRITRILIVTLLLLLVVVPGAALACSLVARDPLEPHIARSELRFMRQHTSARGAWVQGTSWQSFGVGHDQRVQLRGMSQPVTAAYRQQRTIRLVSVHALNGRYYDDEDPATTCELSGQQVYSTPKLLVHETSRAVFMTLVMRRTPGSASGCNIASTSCDDLTLRTVTLDAPIGDRQLYSTTFN